MPPSSCSCFVGKRPRGAQSLGRPSGLALAASFPSLRASSGNFRSRRAVPPAFQSPVLARQTSFSGLASWLRAIRTPGSLPARPGPQKPQLATSLGRSLFSGTPSPSPHPARRRRALLLLQVCLLLAFLGLVIGLYLCPVAWLQEQLLPSLPSRPAPGKAQAFLRSARRLGCCGPHWVPLLAKLVPHAFGKALGEAFLLGPKSWRLPGRQPAG